MKAIHVLTGFFLASALAASAASIEQFLDITITGNYQGGTTNVPPLEHETTPLIRINTANVVHAVVTDLVAEFGLGVSNFFTGNLIYKTPLDGSTTNIVIRQLGKTNEINVDDFISIVPGPFVTNQLVDTSTMTTNIYLEHGLRSLSINTSSLAFTNLTYGFGTARRTGKLTGLDENGQPVSGYATVLNYTGEPGAFVLNTNAFYHTNFTFKATNTVTGTAQLNFRTFSPVIRALP